MQRARAARRASPFRGTRRTAITLGTGTITITITMQAMTGTITTSR